MRRLALVLLLVFAPTFGWSAGGLPGRITVVKPAAPAPLRGTQAPDTGAYKPITPLKPSLPVGRTALLQTPTPWSLAGDPAPACRTQCAQDRYFCEAGGQSDGCGAVWSQCAAACSAPNLAPPSATD
jgi:hypothetical protein